MQVLKSQLMGILMNLYNELILRGYYTPSLDKVRAAKEGVQVDLVEGEEGMGVQGRRGGDKGNKEPIVLLLMSSFLHYMGFLIGFNVQMLCTTFIWLCCT